MSKGLNSYYFPQYDESSSSTKTNPADMIHNLLSMCNKINSCVEDIQSIAKSDCLSKTSFREMKLYQSQMKQYLDNISSTIKTLESKLDD